jgi:arginyl-tRNA synthetase
VPDVAYHLTKWRRGFTQAINIQGTDHHSTVTRVRAGLEALGLGIPAGYPDYVLHSLVKVMRGGAEVKISKRAGSYVTVRDLIDWVGRDAVRFFLVSRKADSEFVFDVDLAREKSEENPVYYVQYAHTRMAGIFRNAGLDPVAVGPDFADLAPLTADAEVDLLKLLAQYPDIVARAADALEPHRVIAFLEDLARAVNAWYHHHRVLGEPAPVERARLALARAAQIVLANGLTLLGISAPERM